jgi:hypothetical protein
LRSYAWNLFLISSLIDFGKKKIIKNKIEIAKAKAVIAGQGIVIIFTNNNIIGTNDKIKIVNK